MKQVDGGALLTLLEIGQKCGIIWLRHLYGVPLRVRMVKVKV